MRILNFVAYTALARRPSNNIIRMSSTKASVSNIDKFLQLSNYDQETKRSRITCCDEFKDDYQSLENNNGGGWCRFDGTFGKKYKAITVKKNGVIKYSWDVEPEEEQEIKTLLSEHTGGVYTGGLKEGAGNGIHYIMIYGEQNQNAGRPIGAEIRKFYQNQPCVVCGATNNVEIDHKNGLYNDPRVLSAKTQTVDDFQPLCKHCNDQKRGTIKKMKETGVRYPATSVPSLRVFGVDYIKGDATYEVNDPDTMVGTYWYDPIVFMECLVKKT